MCTALARQPINLLPARLLVGGTVWEGSPKISGGASNQGVSSKAHKTSSKFDGFLSAFILGATGFHHYSARCNILLYDMFSYVGGFAVQREEYGSSSYAVMNCPNAISCSSQGS
jgi:hypothetical protein